MKLQEAKLSDVRLLQSKIKKLDDFGYKNGNSKEASIRICKNKITEEE